MRLLIRWRKAGLTDHQETISVDDTEGVSFSIQDWLADNHEDVENWFDSGGSLYFDPTTDLNSDEPPPPYGVVSTPVAKPTAKPLLGSTITE